MRQSQGKQEINVEDFPSKCMKKSKEREKKNKKIKKKSWTSNSGRPTADFQKFQERDWKKLSTNSSSKSSKIAE